MRYRATLLAVLALGLGGCFAARREFVLPPPMPIVAKPLPQPEMENPPEIETLEIQTPLPAVAIAEFNLDPAPEIETPAPKPVSRKKPPSTPAPVTPTPGQASPEVDPTPPPAAPAALQLSEILTDDRKRQIETEFSASVMRARAAVTWASGRTLTTQQNEAVQRIRTFLEQAEESKAKDLVTALQLARRADLLGQDLLKSRQ
jgi:hypothetical protein